MLNSKGLKACAAHDALSAARTAFRMFRWPSWSGLPLRMTENERRLGRYMRDGRRSRHR
jgi:hypothetical protein